MTLSNSVALFTAMVALALLPSLSVMTVLARSAALGFFHGAATSLGIVAGDVLYILLAIYGLAFLTERMGGAILLIQYAGAAYLIWLGLSLWRSKSLTFDLKKPPKASLVSSFLAGFLLTVADQKVVLFYLGFFPAFVDIATLSIVDAGIVVAIATTAVGGVKLGYALIADRARFLLANAKTSRGMNLIAGAIMIGAGIAVLLRS
ncbi:Homoserine/homoserine lactone efflux protein [Acaryochloris thomasi RCC1774]|uniref:Homoserine/homoserine lactone efflux protein n=1 Tax=Acaryochloris thomasi RCC1774 TaxID=1764569 RepID=A0A2W1JCZ8_9CYAN|nr:LysE family translocator [Acaryochloris thomasi]PZD71810.1 Homoserine/homoserine lactone efflux protein [Acaryochloris thomasi RCC1774]